MPPEELKILRMVMEEIGDIYSSCAMQLIRQKEGTGITHLSLVICQTKQDFNST